MLMESDKNQAKHTQTFESLQADYDLVLIQDMWSVAETGARDGSIYNFLEKLQMGISSFRPTKRNESNFRATFLAVEFLPGREGQRSVVTPRNWSDGFPRAPRDPWDWYIYLHLP